MKNWIELELKSFSEKNWMNWISLSISWTESELNWICWCKLNWIGNELKSIHSEITLVSSKTSVKMIKKATNTMTDQAATNTTVDREAWNEPLRFRLVSNEACDKTFNHEEQVQQHSNICHFYIERKVTFLYNVDRFFQDHSVNLDHELETFSRKRNLKRKTLCEVARLVQVQCFFLETDTCREKPLVLDLFYKRALDTIRDWDQHLQQMLQTTQDVFGKSWSPVHMLCNYISYPFHLKITLPLGKNGLLLL